MKPETKSSAVDSIVQEMLWWEKEMENQGRIVEAQRIHQRTRFDLEMIKEMGYCDGIENYSRHFTGRLPGELDHRPLTFEEFQARVNQLIYVSATPGPYELTKSAGVIVEQIIRPTGLVDPQ